MKTQYINKIINQAADLDYQTAFQYVGLFSCDKKPVMSCEGTFMSWYTNIYFTDITLLACYCIKSPKNGVHWNIKGISHLEENIMNKHYNKIEIQNICSTLTLEAKDDKEAIKKFFNEEFL